MISKLLAVSGSDAKNDFIAFLQKNVVWICVGICVIIAITIICILLAGRKKKNKENK